MTREVGHITEVLIHLAHNIVIIITMTSFAPISSKIEHRVVNGWMKKLGG